MAIPLPVDPCGRAWTPQPAEPGHARKAVREKEPRQVRASRRDSFGTSDHFQAMHHKPGRISAPSLVAQKDQGLYGLTGVRERVLKSQARTGSCWAAGTGWTVCGLGSHPLMPPVSLPARPVLRWRRPQSRKAAPALRRQAPARPWRYSGPVRRTHPRYRVFSACHWPAALL